MILNRLFARKVNSVPALYEAIVAAARQPDFYESLAVDDTVDGRFDLIVLHMFLVLDRLKGCDQKQRQNLTDAFFLDMDRSLREMGVGDLSVGKKVRKMAEAFYGRIAAYSDAMAKGETELVAALARNVYAGAENTPAPALAVWVLNARQTLASQSAADIIAARIVFPRIVR